MSKAYKVTKRTVMFDKKNPKTVYSVSPVNYGTLTTDDVTNQCGIGGGTVNVASGTNPASAIHPLSSASEKTQPFCVVSAMFTANKAENFGAVCVSSVIMSSTMMRPPGLSARLARFRMSTICAGDSWCSAPKIVTTS